MDTNPTGRIAATLAALAAVGLIDACDAFGPTDRVTVRLPEPPPHWRAAFPRLAVELEYPGPGGSLQVAGPFAWGASLEVACARDANGAFLAWPVDADDRRRLLRPAGGLYPLHLCGGDGRDELCLTWADGCLAVVMLRLAVAGCDTALVNAARLAGYLAAEPDPWRWDLGHIEERLGGGGFTAYDLDRLPIVDAVAQPGAGEWFLETPFSATMRTAADGTLALPALPHGLHTLFATDGRRVRVSADARGVFTLPLSTVVQRAPCGPPALSPPASAAPTARQRTRARSRKAAA